VSLATKKTKEFAEQIVVFEGAVTEPVAFPHFICGSYCFLGQMTISANFSRFAMTRDDAKAFLNDLAKTLIDETSNATK
jgi:hypothetical protein